MAMARGQQSVFSTTFSMSRATKRSIASSETPTGSPTTASCRRNAVASLRVGLAAKPNWMVRVHGSGPASGPALRRSAPWSSHFVTSPTASGESPPRTSTSSVRATPSPAMARPTSTSTRSPAPEYDGAIASDVIAGGYAPTSNEIEVIALIGARASFAMAELTTRGTNASTQALIVTRSEGHTTRTSALAARTATAGHLPCGDP
mmetsp:Transcript_6990/g.29156  ORF Transcript_6990/g.29156 Transcript_6990/m.29156 type:complete len:205 (+) Transcript_6990:816-1430(+)